MPSIELVVSPCGELLNAGGRNFRRVPRIVVTSSGLHRSRVRFPALPHILRSSGSGTGSTQPRESITEELLEWKSSGSGSRKPRLTAVGIRSAERDTHYPHEVGTHFADMRRSLGRYSSLAD
jgi:hypothetical protein